MRELAARRRPWLELFGWALSAIGALSFAHFPWQAANVTRVGRDEPHRPSAIAENCQEIYHR